MSFVSVGRSLKIASYVAFKMAALWFWTMFNCNPPIAHCHPLLWGGGILVDHWSTISSCYWQTRILTTIAHAQTNRRASRVSALALLFCKGTSRHPYPPPEKYEIPVSRRWPIMLPTHTNSRRNNSYIQVVIRNTTKMFLIIPYIMSDLSRQFYQNLSTRFLVMMLTDKTIRVKTSPYSEVM